MSEIDFQVNEFYSYEVQVEGLSLGFTNPNQTPYTPKRGEILQYDGTTVILQDGQEFKNVIQLRSAITGSNWLVRVGGAPKKVQMKSANIKVRPTETRGNERVVRAPVQTHQADEREVISIADRKAAREATNAEATRRVPLESQEARKAVAAQTAPLQLVGDEAVDDLLMDLDADLSGFVVEAEAEPEVDHDAERKAELDADILAALDWATQPTPVQVAPAKPQVQPTTSARRLPVDMQDDRKSMPIVREDPTENAGTVVGNVAEKGRTIIQEEATIAMKVAKAKPDAPQQVPARMGNTGAIVVDEQRDMGTIGLSSTAAPIRLDESAKVVSGSRETIKMGDNAQIGRKKTAGAAPAVSVEGGIAVGRIKSPTKMSFVASDANTSSTAIDNTAKGKRLRVERYEVDETVVGNVSEGAEATAVATGDVQEATAGDTLAEVLPDAAQGPKPEVYRRPEDDPAYKAIQMMIPDFKWDRDRPLGVKKEAILKHIENPQYVKGILAVESEIAKTELKKAIAAELQRRKKAKLSQKAEKEAE